MLTEAELLLLAEAVDGDLTPKRAKAFFALLQSCPEAVRTFEQLKTTAHLLRGLPKLRAPEQLTSAILDRIAAPQIRQSQRRAFTAWVPIALAASVLSIVVGAALWFVWKANSGREQARTVTPTTVASQTIKSRTSTPTTARERPFVATAKPQPSNLEETIAKAGPEAEPAPITEIAVTPSANEESIFGNGFRVETKPLKFVELQLPTLLTASEFHQEQARERLKKELARDTVCRMDLFSRNPALVLEHFQIAAKALQVHLLTEAVTVERLKKPAGFTFGVYLENLSAEELVQLFAELSKSVASASTSKSEPVLGLAHLITAGSYETKDVKELVGVEFTSGKALKASSWAPVAEPKPISSDTLAKITQVLKKSDKAGLILTYLPQQQRAMAGKSLDVKQFLDKRGDRKPGTVPAFIVIRTGG